MAYSTAYRHPASAGQPSPSRKISPQAAIGGAGLAVVVMACAWTVYINVLGPTVKSMVVELPPVTFVPGAAAALKTSVAKLDVSSVASIPPSPVAASPSATPTLSFNERFVARSDDWPASKPALAKGDRLAVAAPQSYAVASLAPDVAAAPEAAPDTRETTGSLPPPDIRAATVTVPLPMPRPASLRAMLNDGASRGEIAQANKAAALAAIAQPKLTIFEKLFGRQEKGPTLAFASPDGGITSDGSSLTPGRYDKQTAIYDISARAVYLPNGTKLEAHSGLGAKMDDPRFVHVRMHGATPPHTYDLAMRESLFHGVEAIRLHPVGGPENIHGRTGLLAHSYLLGPRGDSNGCVSFKDYEAFLRAYKNNEITRLVVVAKLD